MNASKGLVVVDLASGQVVHHQARWGHPCWLPDDTPSVLLDVETGRSEPIAGLPRLRGSHPSADLRGEGFVTDSDVHAGDDDVADRRVVLASLSSGENTVIPDCGADAGASSWRVPHPHPVFSADGERVYFHANDGPWTRPLVVALEPR